MRHDATIALILLTLALFTFANEVTELEWDLKVCTQPMYNIYLSCSDGEMTNNGWMNITLPDLLTHENELGSKLIIWEED